MAQKVVLGNCQVCDAEVGAASVKNRVATPAGHRFFYVCAQCQSRGTIFWSRERLEMYRESAVTEQEKTRSQMIGNLVYGFKQDLEVFSVGEIIGLWEYEESYSPDTIPVETNTRVWLR